MIRTIVCVFVVLLVTLSTSYTMSKYQNDLVNKSNEYVDLIKKIPEDIGNWKRVSVKPLLPSEAEELKVRDAEHWTYKNTKNDAWVVLSIFVGPTGRVGVHTPELCLAGAGYQISENRVPESFKIVDEHSQADEILEDKSNSDELIDPQQFWRVVITDEATPNFQRVFYYALGTGKKWWAVNNPRFELSS
ncbi:MAG: EpsI family protein, partial [Planctomycetaceae bacterium]|nr:EpsI family protein [Planctomycetaceae bacterium]